jgi:hypothetical protein
LRYQILLLLLHMAIRERSRIQNNKTMINLKIDNKEFKGEFIPFPNLCGFNFKLENGKLLEGVFIQGRSGVKEFEMPVNFDLNKNLARAVNNSSRQVKDPNAYFLRFN